MNPGPHFKLPVKTNERSPEVIFIKICFLNMFLSCVLDQLMRNITVFSLDIIIAFKYDKKRKI